MHPKTNEIERLINQGVSARKIIDQLSVSSQTVSRVRKNMITPTIPNHGNSIQCGLTRDQVQLRHDIPARIKKALDETIQTFQDGLAYEENEIFRLCRVAGAEREYWDRITSEPHYAQHTGWTEKGIRLWGTQNEIRWMEENVTGFRRS